MHVGSADLAKVLRTGGGGLRGAQLLPFPNQMHLGSADLASWRWRQLILIFSEHQTEGVEASLSAEASVEYVLTVCWRSQGYILIFILKITKPYYLNFQIYVYFFGLLNPGLKKLLTIRR